MQSSLSRWSLVGRRSTARKPVLEPLEDRCVPAAIPVPAADPFQLVLISDSVDQAEQVAAAALPGVTTVVYPAATITPNGLIALLEELTAAHGRATIDQLALVTHGTAGHIAFGLETVWDLDHLPAAHLRSLLSPQAQLDLYVCNLAEGPEGQAFVRALADGTGATVRASTNPVGSGGLGDFQWEFIAGAGVPTRGDLLAPATLDQLAGLVLHDDPYEPNNSKAQVDAATRPEGAEGSPRLGILTATKTITGLVMSDAADWFQFKTRALGSSGHFVRIDFTNANGDLDLQVFRMDGTTRVGASATSNQNFEQVSLDRTPPGTYYAKVFPKSGTPDTSYSLRIEPPSSPVPPTPSTSLVMSVDVTDVSEAAGAGAVYASVSRRGSTTAALNVTFTSSRPGDVAAPAPVTIPVGVERVNVPVNVTDNTVTDGTRGVTLTATATGVQPASATFNVLDNEGLNGLFLSQSAYTGVEGGTGVRVTVVRGSQDAGTSVSVIYVTNDGTAKAGTDYTAASGTLTLAAGELAKSITIALTDDNVAKAGRTFTVSLSSFGSSAPLLSPARATVTISDNDLPLVADSNRPNGVSAAADIFAHSRELYTNFVNTAYQKYLKRTADPNGLNGWVEGMLARRVTDEQLEAGFIGSPEYIQQNGGRGRGWIVGMYRDLLGRTPGEVEVNGWLQALSNGTTEPQVAFGFAASAEREGQRVQENYRVYLERTPGQAEVDGYVTEFVAGRLTNEDVVARFIGSPEYYSSPQRGQGNRAAWVARVYEQVLFRQPSRAEVEGWLTNLT